MIPTARKAPFNDPDWVFELKYDGFRVLGIKDGTRTSLLSRKGNELIGCFPEISVAMNALPNLVLDGELVYSTLRAGRNLIGYAEGQLCATH